MKATSILKATAYAELVAGVIGAIVVFIGNYKSINTSYDFTVTTNYHIGEALIMALGVAIADIIAFASILTVAQMADNIEKIQIDVEKIANRTEEEKE
jgi:hypothetical protein